MRQAWKKYLSTNAPRYTSYPSALHFDTSVTAPDFAAKLGETALYDPISLYVHVPFCRQLCWYCGCNMRVENFYARAHEYVDALIEELRMVAASLAGKGRPVGVHFGGGTPNYLVGSDLSRILSAIEGELGLTDSARLAIELDPRLLRCDDIDHLASLGFNRFSLGIQDFDPVVQDAINRIQSFDLIEACVSDIRNARIDDLSFDILYGLPKQTEESFARTIEMAVALGPDRVSVFGYAHLPQLLRHQKMIDAVTLPDEALRGSLAVLADEMLRAAGYRRVGFDHYAKPDNAIAKAALTNRLHRNFQGFTDDSSSTLIGVGASAISFIDGLYAQNEKSIAGYQSKINAGELPVAHGLVQTKREARIAAAIDELLCTMSANIGTVLKGAPPADAIDICTALEQFEIDGVIRWEDDQITMTEGAHVLARTVAAALDPYARPKMDLSVAV